MNIFILSLIISECVKYHNDKHVVKMILESAQLLCTCHRVLSEDIPEFFYKKVHMNHPCSIWLRESNENYMWLYNLFIELCNEYTFRYNKIHKCDKLFRDILNKVPENIPILPMTCFKIAIGKGSELAKKYNELLSLETELHKKQIIVVNAYREYYITEKAYFCKWTKRDIPEWFTNS